MQANLKKCLYCETVFSYADEKTHCPNCKHKMPRYTYIQIVHIENISDCCFYAITETMQVYKIAFDKLHLSVWTLMTNQPPLKKD